MRTGDIQIMYIHGFGSKMNYASPKTEALSEMGNVVGMDYDFTASAESQLERLSEYAINQKVDLIVGCSLGGWYAAALGESLGVPFVMMNPCVDPKEYLRKYIGDHIDFHNNEFTMTAEACDSYGPLSTKGFGLVLVDKGDDVIPYTAIDSVEHDFTVKEFEGGDHRFAHTKEALKDIARHYVKAELCYGFNM